MAHLGRLREAFLPAPKAYSVAQEFTLGCACICGQFGVFCREDWSFS